MRLTERAAWPGRRISPPSPRPCRIGDAAAARDPDSLYFLFLPMRSGRPLPTAHLERVWRLQTVGSSYLLLSAKDALDCLRTQPPSRCAPTVTPFPRFDTEGGQIYSWTSDRPACPGFPVANPRDQNASRSGSISPNRQAARNERRVQTRARDLLLVERTHPRLGGRGERAPRRNREGEPARPSVALVCPAKFLGAPGVFGAGGIFQGRRGLFLVKFRNILLKHGTARCAVGCQSLSLSSPRDRGPHACRRHFRRVALPIRRNALSAWRNARQHVR